MIINHRDLEMAIGTGCHCDSYPLKVAAYFTHYNKITVAAERGTDKFFLAPRDPKTDLSDAIPISTRYLVIGDINRAENVIFQQCVLYNKADAWFNIPDDLYLTRLLIAGAIRIVVLKSELAPVLAQTPEYKQAVTDGRVIFVCE